ncbi:MAG: TolC family protein, partial [Acidobacteria bacterium]|nr:TolC family protein [Acidobacteriota bacterium]
REAQPQPPESPLPTSSPESPALRPQSPPAGATPQTPAPPAPGGELKGEIPAVAADFRAPPQALPELGRVGVDMTEQRPLTLREAIELALKNAKDIEIARSNVRAAEFDLLGARGVYDPRFVSQSFYERTETPATSFLAGGAGGSVAQTNLFGSLRLEGLTPKGGGNYRFDFSSGRQTSDNVFSTLNPLFPSAFTLTYTQPLLRGYRFDQNRRLIEIAKKNLSLTDAQFRQRAIETITSVQRAYWDLVFSLRNLQVQRDAVRDARLQLEHNRRLVTEGVLAPIDVVAAEAQVSTFEQGVYAALDEVGRAENSLKNLIAENRTSEVWRVALVPTDTVDFERPPAVSLEQAMDSALKGRPELQQSDVAAAINELDQRLAREMLRPQVDLVGSYGAVGVAGTLDPARAVNPFTAQSEALRLRVNELSAANGLQPLPDPPAQALPEQLVGGYPQSLANLAANRFNNYRVGVQLNLPLRNRTAEAQLGRTLVERDRIKLQREQLEQLIQVDVRNALQVARTAEARLRAASIARAAGEQQYASEQRKFDAGQSTFFLVLERQTALAAARAAELRAQTELNKAAVELQRATGNALEANQVRVSSR